MLKNFSIVTGGLKSLRLPFALNFVALILRGMPLALLCVIITELVTKGRDADIEKIFILVGIICLIFIGHVLLSAQAQTKACVGAYTIIADARVRLATHLKDLPLSFFKSRDPGDITANLLQDMSRVENVMSHLLVEMTSGVILPILLAAWLFWINWQLALFMIAGVVISGPLVWWAHQWVGRLGKRHVTAQNDMLLHMLEFLEGIKDLKSNNIAGERLDLLNDAMRRNRDLSVGLEVAGVLPLMFFRCILDLSFVAIILLAVTLLASESVVPATCIIFLILGQHFYEPLHLAGSFSTLVRYISLAARRIATVFSFPKLSGKVSPLVPIGNDVEFQDVSFAYHDKSVINNVSFTTRSGTMTALVGPSGGGKTTLAGLIARFYDVAEGQILLGGVDVRDVDPHVLYDRIAMIFQDVYLFDDTVENNIRLGCPEASFEAVREAARQANCLSCIESLPQGWQTRVGEGGRRLSGGERQRISIARALLKDAPIVLVDEATASLDPENAFAVQDALAHLAEGRTVIVIAHRLSSIISADQILVLDSGRIVAQGQHEILLAAGGLYAELWKDQQAARRWQLKANTVNG
ncbi:ABC transporter ATP-binding protein [Desulfovibrio inopinatus]|uniref:ABC transporter ATP-binding protein n=1 Tax=Desulfovibrio inopinatus TaxID=102109 RepID=UPI000485B3C7|nr:ABC transporter ATP-binding protein [Desulfovibrio inopinatus]